MASRIGLGLRSAFRFAFQSNARQGAKRTYSQAAAEGEKASFNLGEWARGPTGPKTVHFWAPVMKWGVVLAGVSDFARPAESLSLSQNAALTATGAIWTRWCLIIKPRNVLLASVNFLLGIVGAVQVGRIFMYRRSLPAADSPIQATAVEAVDAVKKVSQEVTK